MEFKKPRNLEAVIFDWAGTTVDFGCFAPTQVFVDAFKTMGVDVSLEEARRPMGLAKIDHIRALLADLAIHTRWTSRFGRPPTEQDAQKLYDIFLPLQIEKIADYSEIIPGTLETISWLRSQGIKIGSCSGYPRTAMERVARLAAIAGYEPDYWVSSDDVPHGRPLPSQALLNVVRLSIESVSACVKVDDTAPGLLEGRRAGMWTVAVLGSSNNLGLSLEQWNALDKNQQNEACGRVQQLLEPSGAHFYIRTIADLPKVIEQISERLALGLSPDSY